MMTKFLFVAVLAGTLMACGETADEVSVSDEIAISCNRADNLKLAQAAGKGVPLKLQLPWFANGEHSYAFLGDQLAIFDAYGLDVEVITGRGSEVAARALGAGEVDAAIIGSDAMVLINDEGGDLRSVGIVYRETPVTIYSLPGSGINKPTDLYGKRLGLLPGSNTVSQYEGFASQIGLDRSRIIEVPVQPQQAQGMIIGETVAKSDNPQEVTSLDALVHYTQFAPLEERINRKMTMTEIRLADYGVKILGMVLAVRENSLPNRNVENLAKALKASFKCARQSPQRSIDALAAANPTEPFGFNSDGTPQEDRAYAIAQLEALIAMACKERGENCVSFLDQSKADWDETIATLKNFKLLDNAYTPADLIYTPGRLKKAQ